MTNAIVDDEELAESLVDEDLPQRGESMREWSPERDALARIEDMLGAIVSTIVAVNGGKPPRIPPAPRPETAMERVRAQRAKNQYLSLVAQLIPEEGA